MVKGVSVHRLQPKPLAKVSKNMDTHYIHEEGRNSECGTAPMDDDAGTRHSAPLKGDTHRSPHLFGSNHIRHSPEEAVEIHGRGSALPPEKAEETHTREKLLIGGVCGGDPGTS